MLLRRWLILGLVVGLWAGRADAQGLPAEEAGALGFDAAKLSEVTDLLERNVREGRFAGISALVARQGRVVLLTAAGQADREAGEPMAPDTIVRIASMTKSFVALAILQLRDAAQLGLDDPVVRFVPELAALRYPTTDAAPLTLRHLLTMNAGWPEDNPWGDRQLALDDDGLAALLAQGLTFASAPNTQYEYSNLGYMILGRVVRQVAGQPFQEYTAQHILQPLGMLDARWNVDAPDQPTAKGYRLVNGDFSEDQDAWASCHGDAAGFGGLYLSVNDLAKWVAFMLSAWPPRDGEEHPVLRRASLRDMQRCSNLRPLSLAAQPVGQPVYVDVGGYAFGLFAAETQEFGRLVGHSGGLPGYGSHMVWLPDRDIGVVTLANRTYAPAVPAAMAILRHVVSHAQLTARAVQPHPALLTAQAGVTRLVQQWDDALADELTAANFFLDTPRAAWRQQVETLRHRHGALQPDGAIEVDNPLRGQWRLRGERGWCTLWITLTPTVPPRVQHLRVDSFLPPDDKMQQALERVLAATAKPVRRAIDRLLAPESDRAAFLQHLRIVNLLYGAPQLERIIGGDGVERCVAGVQTNHGALELTVVLNPDTGKVRTAEYRATR